MPVAAIQTTIGLAIAGVLVAGWIVYLVVAGFRSGSKPGDEIELAPNRRPYLDDEAMEGPRLDRNLAWGLLTLAFVAVALPAYWLMEPGRQSGAEEGFDRRAAQRGAALFASTQAHPPGFGCADCHGPNGEGGVAKFVINADDPDNLRQVDWAAPALNTVRFRFDADEVEEILIYGRPGTPMPAWGVQGGGAMGPQQITDLVAYIESIQLEPEEALEQSKTLAEQEATAAGKSTIDGEVLFNTFCARCHTKGWSYRSTFEEPDAEPGGGAFGPNLRDGATRRQFPGREGHIEFLNMGSDYQKLYGERGIGSGRMPGFGPDPDNKRKGALLTEEQIRMIVEYERSL